MRLRRLYLVAGIAVGYVLGSRAGRERYEEIADAARRLADRPDVQSAAGIVAEQLSHATRQAMTMVGARVSEETRDKVTRAPYAVISRISPTNAAPPAEPAGDEGDRYLP